VLAYHVVAGEVPAADVVAATELTSVEGSPIAVSVDGETVQVNSATVTATDVEASNGVIHVIDRVIIPPVTLEEVDPLAAEGDIIVAGSSTVFPVAERLADMFNDAGFGGEITVESIGTGGGFERFCVNAETDVANASRAIREEEVAACVENGRTPVGFFIGIDALAVVVSSENDFLTDLSTEQLAQIFSGAVTTWDQVDPSFPAEEIRLFSPGSDSGTFDYFVEEIFDGDETQILNAAGIQLSEDDNVLVQGVEGSPYAIGYFGYAYYQENQDRLKSLSIDTVAPTAETAEAGEYPLSRPLYIYTAPEVVAEKPQVATFINYFLTNVNSVYGTGEGSIGYFPTSADNQNLDKVLFLAITAGE
jgi:phosphate transport system substrate-binding protein